MSLLWRHGISNGALNQLAKLAVYPLRGLFLPLLSAYCLLFPNLRNLWIP